MMSFQEMAGLKVIHIRSPSNKMGVTTPEVLCSSEKPSALVSKIQQNSLEA